jgi:hypothetical protein
VIFDQRQQQSLLSVALPAYVQDSVIYAPRSTAIAPGGPYVTIVATADPKADGAEGLQAEVKRGMEMIPLRADAAGQLTATIGKVKPFEPLTVFFKNARGDTLRTTETDCVYGGSSRGLVSIRLTLE